MHSLTTIFNLIAHCGTKIVAVFYTGYFANGTIFDTNDNTKKKSNPLRFKVGSGTVIPGWDDAMLSMSRGEKAKIVIPAEHAYGKKGVPDAKIPIRKSIYSSLEDTRKFSACLDEL